MLCGILTGKCVDDSMRCLCCQWLGIAHVRFGKLVIPLYSVLLIWLSFCFDNQCAERPENLIKNVVVQSRKINAFFKQNITPIRWDLLMAAFLPFRQPMCR